jgi:hypothetical protein
MGKVMLHSRHHHHGRNSAIIIGRSGEVWKQPVAHIFVGHVFFHQKSDLLRHGTNISHVNGQIVPYHEILLAIVLDKFGAELLGVALHVETELRRDCEPYIV